MVTAIPLREVGGQGEPIVSPPPYVKLIWTCGWKPALFLSCGYLRSWSLFALQMGVTRRAFKVDRIGISPDVLVPVRLTSGCDRACRLYLGHDDFWV